MAPRPARRLFIAVMLPEQVRATLAGLISKLDAHAAILRPVRAEALHVTLVFLGDRDDHQARHAAEACAAAARVSPAFALAIGGFGAFPSARRPRVVWLGLRDGAAPLRALHACLQDELVSRGVISTREQLTPHLTLARVRPEASSAQRAALGGAIDNLPTAVQARCSAGALSLVHSTLMPQGPRYALLGEWPLQGA